MVVPRSSTFTAVLRALATRGCQLVYISGCSDDLQVKVSLDLADDAGVRWLASMRGCEVLHQYQLPQTFKPVLRKSVLLRVKISRLLEVIAKLIDPESSVSLDIVYDF